MLGDKLSWNCHGGGRCCSGINCRGLVMEGEGAARGDLWQSAGVVTAGEE